MDMVTTRDAANRLGISGRRVLELITQGDLDATLIGGRYLIDGASIIRREQLGGHGSRPLAGRMSWAILLSDLGTIDVDVVSRAMTLSRSEQARMRALRLRAPADWGWLARRRAEVHRFTARQAYVDELLDQPNIVRSGVSALADYAVDLTARPGIVEIYTSTTSLRHLAETYRLRTADQHNLIVHEIDDRFPAVGFVLNRAVMTVATVAVDLIESAEPRARRAGLDVLERLTSGAQ